MRRLILLAMVAAMALAAAAPALAQSADEQNGTGGKATLTFEVYTEGRITADTTFFAGYAGPGFGLTTLQLTDPDGDGTYSGSVSLDRGERYEVRIIQGTGTETAPLAGGSVTIPGEPSQLLLGIQTITLDEDRTVSASYSGPGNTDDQYGNDDAQIENASLSFELATDGECSAETTFFAESDAVRVADDVVPQRLTDPDGDGVYTVSAQYPVGTQLEDVRILRGTGVNDVPFQSGTFEAPGEPISVVKDFGSLTLESAP